MRQVIFGGGPGLDPVATEHFPISTSTPPIAGDCEQIVAAPGKLTNLRCQLSVAPGAGASYTFTLLLNGVPTGITCTIAGTDTLGGEPTQEVIVSPGDAVQIEVVPAGAPAVADCYSSILFYSDNPNECLMPSRGWAAAGNFQRVSHGQANGGWPEIGWYQISPMAGTIKNLYVKQYLAAGVAGKGYRYTLRLNGVDTALTSDIISPALSGQDIVNSVNVVPGDILTVGVISIIPPTVQTPIAFGMCFVSPVEDEAPIFGGTSNNLDPIATEYNNLKNAMWWAWDANESWFYDASHRCTFKHLYVRLQVAPGAGSSYTFSVRRNGADTALQTVIQDANVLSGNTVDEIIIVAGDLFTIQVVPFNAPAVGDSWWACIQVYNPAIPPPPMTKPTVQTLPATGVT